MGRRPAGQVMAATEMAQFGSRRFRLPFDATGKKSVRCLGLNGERGVHAAGRDEVILFDFLRGRAPLGATQTRFAAGPPSCTGWPST